MMTHVYNPVTGYNPLIPDAPFVLQNPPAPSPLAGQMPPQDGMPGGPMPPGLFPVSLH